MPLFTEFPFLSFQNSDKLVLLKVIFILKLHFAETQVIVDFAQKSTYVFRYRNVNFKILVFLLNFLKTGI